MFMVNFIGSSSLFGDISSDIGHVHVGVAEVEKLGKLREESAVLKERVASADTRVAAAAARQVRIHLHVSREEQELCTIPAVF